MNKLEISLADFDKFAEGLEAETVFGTYLVFSLSGKPESNDVRYLTQQDQKRQLVYIIPVADTQYRQMKQINDAIGGIKYDTRK